MFVQEKEILLANGQKAILRSLRKEEAKALSDHQYITSEETYYMSRYPEEVIVDLDMVQRKIKTTNEDEKNFSISAIIDGKMIANIAVSRIRNHMKYCHRGYLGISIQKKYCDLGLGSIMIDEAVKLAKENGFEQLELGVFEDNPRAKHIYEKVGFKEFGISPRAFKLKDGTYRNEVQMALVF